MKLVSKSSRFNFLQISEIWSRNEFSNPIKQILDEIE